MLICYSRVASGRPPAEPGHDLIGDRPQGVGPVLGRGLARVAGPEQHDLDAFIYSSTYVLLPGRAYGFAEKSIEESKAICEEVFAATLDGHPLISNRSVWRNFPWIWNKSWSHRNMVLLGDAVHTAHFSIGSGTRLAMEDAIALVRAWRRTTTAMRRARRLSGAASADCKKIVDAANASATGTRASPRRWRLAAARFRVRLSHPVGALGHGPAARDAPAFMAQYEASNKGDGWRGSDRIPSTTTPGALEVGFRPQRLRIARPFFGIISHAFPGEAGRDRTRRDADLYGIHRRSRALGQCLSRRA